MTYHTVETDVVVLWLRISVTKLTVFTHLFTHSFIHQFQRAR